MQQVDDICYYFIIHKDALRSIIAEFTDMINLIMLLRILCICMCVCSNNFRSQRTEMDIWNRRLLLIKTLLSLIYASLYEGTHQSHVYFQSLVMQTRADLQIFPTVREITLLSRIFSSRFKKCHYNVLRRRDITREKTSIHMIYLTSRGYKRRGIMNASLT